MKIHIFNNNMKLRQIMEKDSKREYKDEMQEVMLELKLKTDKFMKKLKDANSKGKVNYGVIK